MTEQEFNSTRKPLYIDSETLLVKFPTQRHMKVPHAVWFSETGIPYIHTIRGYYWETPEDTFLMLYWDDFEVPNVTTATFSYLFEFFPKVNWIGLGCNKKAPGEIWPPKFKILRGEV